MNRDAAIEAGMAALDRSRFPEGDGNLAFLTPRGLDELRDEVAAVINAALPHLVGEPIGYVVVNRANNGFTWLSMDGAVFQRGQVPYERARLDNQIVCALIPAVEP